VVSKRAGPRLGDERDSTLCGGFLFDRKELGRKERLELTRRHLTLALDQPITRLG
jgi:hypothetical protein